jgi:hypothetical protein
MLSVPVHISFRIPLVGRRSAEQEDLEVCVPSEVGGLFQFK